MRLSTLTCLFVWFAMPVARGQCFFSDDYSNPALWTQVRTGIEVRNGRVDFFDTSGSQLPYSERGVYRPLPAALPDSGGWRLELDLTYRSAAAGSSCLLAVALAAGTQQPLVTFNTATGLYEPTRQDGICVQTDGPLFRQTPLPLYMRVSDNGVWRWSDSITLRENAVTYLRLERLNATQIKLSAFVDATRTQHQAGSPICMTIPASVTGLSTVWHGNLPWGSIYRNDDASADNLCLSTTPIVDSTLELRASNPTPCLTTPTAPLTLTASASFSGVTWTLAGSAWTASGNSVQFTPPSAGTYVFTATGQSAAFCAAPLTRTLTVTVSPAPVATLAYATTLFCKPGPPSALPVFSPAGGTFSGTPGLVVNPQTGRVNVTLSVTGSHTVTYTSPGPCPATATATVTIISGAIPALSYGYNERCQNEGDWTPTATPFGGRFSAPPGLAIDSLTGTIRPALSVPGTYLVTYHNAAPCQGQATQSVRIVGLPDYSFSYAPAVFCQSGLSPAPTGDTQGEFSSFPPGIVFDSVTPGVINLGASAPGTYMIRCFYLGFSIGDGPVYIGVCSTRDSFPITIEPLVPATLAYPRATRCEFNGRLAPTVEPLGGRFSGSANLVIDPATGVIDATRSLAGTHRVTYVPNNGCAQPITVDVSVPAAVTLALPNVITPNGDNLNDAFAPDPPVGTTAYHLHVFNRWGRGVWESQQAAESWDARDVAAGLYYYHLQYTDCTGPQHYRGIVEVVK